MGMGWLGNPTGEWLSVRFPPMRVIEITSSVGSQTWSRVALRRFLVLQE
jgi:hypothetical protein